MLYYDSITSRFHGDVQACAYLLSIDGLLIAGGRILVGNKLLDACAQIHVTVVSSTKE